MATKALVGVSKIEYGTVVGDGTMPTSLTEWELFVPDSVVLQFDEPEKTDFLHFPGSFCPEHVNTVALFYRPVEYSDIGKCPAVIVVIRVECEGPERRL